MNNILEEKKPEEYELLRDFIYQDLYTAININHLTEAAKTNLNKTDINNINDTLKSIITGIISSKTRKPVIIITPTIQKALKLVYLTNIFTDINVKLLTPQEATPYDMTHLPSYTANNQAECLERLINNEQTIIITTAKAIITKFINKKEFEKTSIVVNKGAELDPAEFGIQLSEIGYSKVPVIMDPGEYSIKGDIIDIYPVSSLPIRIETAFDEVESIRQINIETQRSIKAINSITIRPKYKLIINKDNKQRLIKELNKLKIKLEEEFQEEKSLFKLKNLENILTLIEEFNYFEGIDYFTPLIYSDMSNLLDYASASSTIIIDEPEEVFEQISKYDQKFFQEYNYKIQSGENIELPYLLHSTKSEVNLKLDNFTIINLKNLSNSAISNHNALDFQYSQIPGFAGNLKNAAKYINELKSKDYKTIITTEYPQRVKGVLSEYGCHTGYIAENSLYTRNSENAIITKTNIMDGFNLLNPKIAIITDFELFGKRNKKLSIAKKSSKRENIDYFLTPTDLNEGDYVVHARHGIGKFSQMLKMTLYGQDREYLMIEYQGNDKLYVPVDQINLLSRYRGVGENPPKLSKMGGADWENTRRKTEKAVEDIAGELLNLYAKRNKTEGFCFDNDSTWQNELEDAFEYVETPDQLTAINDVKRDMESDKPMDRLICGDVGYGKTEVAIRAIFKAVLSGKQVAMLVPTTILAQQHFNTLTERLLPYPVSIGLMSRFRSPREQKETIKRLATGECDIVVGTHRLLQKDIHIKDLGLVVIDEEHRFGVKHKEQLKQLREHIDVISMSATPIPRTLYMSLSGIRDLSLINTAPVNRSPVKTNVCEYDKNLVKMAILRELERNGQIYYVHNRVQSIYKAASEVTELVPEAKIVVGHGQMNEKELENVMLDFSQEKYNILVCTTIIESGLDIPNVNTIIIDNSDYMGLAQLYQLRGRVGRSDRQAYCYCFYNKNKALTEDAKKRLSAIRDFNTLGSGYQVALRDLEIRGIGNILGSRQHGNMVAVGFDLYCEMLEEAILRLQGKSVERKSLPVIDINITAFIPPTWIENNEQKIIEYKRLAAVKSFRELELLQDEWLDRYGKIPNEVMNLITVINTRLLASETGINYIREEENAVKMFTNYDYKFWYEFCRKIPPKLANKTKWVKTPQTCLDGTSAILIKYSGFTPQDLLIFIKELLASLHNHLRDIKGA